jgi:cell division protein ZapA (FtsZ GTPase activity inhibitor)
MNPWRKPGLLAAPDVIGSAVGPFASVEGGDHMQYLAHEVGRTVRYALGSHSRTARLIAIIVAVLVVYGLMRAH